MYGADAKIVSPGQEREKEKGSGKGKGKEKEKEKEATWYEEEYEQEEEEERFDLEAQMGATQIEEMAAQQGLSIRQATEEDLLGILELMKITSSSTTTQQEATKMDFLFNLYR